MNIETVTQVLRRPYAVVRRRNAARAVILTNYARPWNIQRQIETVRALREPTDILLIDNSETEDGRSNLPEMDLTGVALLRTGRNMGNGWRFAVAAELPHAQLSCIDDDIFLSTDQIEALFQRAAREPDRPHGVWGEDVQERFGRLGFKTHLCRQNREVDILNQLYVFTPAQASRAITLAAFCGYPDWSKIGPVDDVFLSYAGNRKPAVHELGPLEQCETASKEGIASWRRPDFYARRKTVLRKLWALHDAEGIAPAALYRAH